MKSFFFLDDILTIHEHVLYINMQVEKAYLAPSKFLMNASQCFHIYTNQEITEFFSTRLIISFMILMKPHSNKGWKTWILKIYTCLYTFFLNGFLDPDHFLMWVTIWCSSLREQVGNNLESNYMTDQIFLSFINNCVAPAVTN